MYLSPCKNAFISSTPVHLHNTAAEHRMKTIINVTEPLKRIVSIFFLYKNVLLRIIRNIECCLNIICLSQTYCFHCTIHHTGFSLSHPLFSYWILVSHTIFVGILLRHIHCLIKGQQWNRKLFTNAVALKCRSIIELTDEKGIKKVIFQNQNKVMN